MSDTQTKTKYETLLDAYNEATERLRKINLLDIGGPESAEPTEAPGAHAEPKSI
jgi:hypothetical protein